MKSQEPVSQQQTQEGDVMGERDPEIERLDREHAQHRAEMRRLWETVGTTREELASMRASVDGVTHELHDFRAESRAGVAHLTASLETISQSVNHTQGSRSGAFSTVKIVLTTVGLTLTLAIVTVGIVRAVLA